MKFILAFSAVLATALAAPSAFEVISSRGLSEKEESQFSYDGPDSSSCPTNGTLPKSGYLSPSLMVPISAFAPDFPFGPSKVSLITPNNFCTIFNFEIPGSAFGKDCTLEFLFPEFPSQTSKPYFYKGSGHFTFTGYAFNSGATRETTFNNQPPEGPSPPMPPAVLEPGNAYVINAGSCAIPEGQKKMTVSGSLCSTDSAFFFKQDTANCPIGFYVVIS